MLLTTFESPSRTTSTLSGLYDFLSDREREEKLVKLIAEILRKKAISKIDELQNTHGIQPKEKETK